MPPEATLHQCPQCHLCSRGGGNNGHITLLMENAAYITRAGVPFLLPAHPGAAPNHAVGASAATIAENIRCFNQVLADRTLYHRVATELKSQILATVDNTISVSLRMSISALPM
jgi:hypothetical protein